MRVTSGPEHGLAAHQIVITLDHTDYAEMVFDWVSTNLRDVEEWSVDSYQVAHEEKICR